MAKVNIDENSDLALDHGVSFYRFYFQYFIHAGDEHCFPTFKGMVRSQKVNSSITSSAENSLLTTIY